MLYGRVFSGLLIVENLLLVLSSRLETVDAVIGGVSSSISLLSFGLSTVGVILVLRWWMWQKSKLQQAETAPEYALPPSSARSPLPRLTDKKRSSY